MSWRALTLSSALLLGALGPVSEAEAQRVNVRAFIEQYDADQEGTVKLEQIRRAAVERFQVLDRKHKGTLTRSQLAGVLNFQQFRKADKNKHGSLDQDEFLSVIEKVFQEADTDHDGTLDQKELSSSAGQALIRMFNARPGPIM